MVTRLDVSLDFVTADSCTTHMHRVAFKAHWILYDPHYRSSSVMNGRGRGPLSSLLTNRAVLTSYLFHLLTSLHFHAIFAQSTRAESIRMWQIGHSYQSWQSQWLEKGNRQGRGDHFPDGLTAIVYSVSELFTLAVIRQMYWASVMPFSGSTWSKAIV